MLSTLRRLILSLLVLKWVVISTLAARYSYAEDFLLPPNHSNKETDVWQLFFGIELTKRDGDYNRLPRLTESEAGVFWMPAGADFPYVGKNTSGRVVNGVQAKEGLVHPSNDGLGLAIAFQAPTNGFYDISGYVRPSYPGWPSGVRWYLDKGNQAGALDSGVLVPTQNRNFHYRAMELKAGERVYLIIQSNGDYRGDSTAVGFEVSPTTFSLELQILPVVTFAGTPGKTYRVEYLDALASDAAWTSITNVVLTTPLQSVVDSGSRVKGQRYYRAVQVD